MKRLMVGISIAGLMTMNASSMEVGSPRSEEIKKVEIVEVKPDSSNSIRELEKEIKEIKAQKTQQKQEPQQKPTKQETISRGGETPILASISVVATAYTEDRITAVGTVPRTLKTVAVDPKVIPLGSLFYISGFPGVVFLAEDTGGDIKGNRIDIFHESRSWCVKTLGRKKVEVKIIKWGKNNVKETKKESQKR